MTIEETYKADHELIERLLTTIRPEQLTLLKMVLPKDLFEAVQTRAKLVKRAVPTQVQT